MTDFRNITESFVSASRDILDKRKPKEGLQSTMTLLIQLLQPW